MGVCSASSGNAYHAMGGWTCEGCGRAFEGPELGPQKGPAAAERRCRGWERWGCGECLYDLCFECHPRAAAAPPPEEATAAAAVTVAVAAVEKRQGEEGEEAEAEAAAAAAGQVDGWAEAAAEARVAAFEWIMNPHLQQLQQQTQQNSSAAARGGEPAAAATEAAAGGAVRRGYGAGGAGIADETPHEAGGAWLLDLAADEHLLKMVRTVCG